MVFMTCEELVERGLQGGAEVFPGILLFLLPRAHTRPHVHLLKQKKKAALTGAALTIVSESQTSAPQRNLGEGGRSADGAPTEPRVAALFEGGGGAAPTETTAPSTLVFTQVGGASATARRRWKPRPHRSSTCRRAAHLLPASALQLPTGA